MRKLVYSAITSLDGYVADADGRFDWAVPDSAVHAVVNNLMRRVGTQLYGRRLYEVMVAWESMDVDGESDVTRDFAVVWRDSDKIVYSRTLETVASARTRIEQAFLPDEIRRLKASMDRDLLVGGPDLAGHAFRAGLVDEVHLFVSPVVVGGGTRALPDGVRLDLELLAEQRFDSGVVQLSYSTRA